MQKIAIVLSIVVVFLWIAVVPAMADSKVTFTWAPNSETDLRGYRLYQSDASGQYTFGGGNEVAMVPVGTETVTLSDVPDGTWYWVLTAFDNATPENESGPSNEVTATLDSSAPAPPENMLISAIGKMISALEDIRAYYVEQKKIVPKKVFLGFN